MRDVRPGRAFTLQTFRLRRGSAEWWLPELVENCQNIITMRILWDNVGYSLPHWGVWASELLQDLESLRRGR